MIYKARQRSFECKSTIKAETLNIKASSYSESIRDLNLYIQENKDLLQDRKSPTRRKHAIVLSSLGSVNSSIHEAKLSSFLLKLPYFELFTKRYQIPQESLHRICGRLKLLEISKPSSIFLSGYRLFCIVIQGEVIVSRRVNDKRPISHYTTDRSKSNNRNSLALENTKSLLQKSTSTRKNAADDIYSFSQILNKTKIGLLPESLVNSSMKSSLYKRLKQGDSYCYFPGQQKVAKDLSAESTLENTTLLYLHGDDFLRTIMQPLNEEEQRRRRFISTSIPFLSKGLEANTDLVLSSIEFQDFKKSEFVYSNGEKASKLYLLYQGSCLVLSRKGERLNFLDKGAFFGIESLNYPGYLDCLNEVKCNSGGLNFKKVKPPMYCCDVKAVEDFTVVFVIHLSRYTERILKSVCDSLRYVVKGHRGNLKESMVRCAYVRRFLREDKEKYFSKNRTQSVCDARGGGKNGRKSILLKPEGYDRRKTCNSGSLRSRNNMDIAYKKGLKEKQTAKLFVTSVERRPISCIPRKIQSNVSDWIRTLQSGSHTLCSGEIEMPMLCIK